MDKYDFLFVTLLVDEGTWWVMAARPLGSVPVSGPYSGREDAESAMITQAYRIRQGWSP